MLTRKQAELLRFIHERLKEAGVPPSFDEMKDALDLRSKSGIHRLITALEERGFIRRLPNRARRSEEHTSELQSLYTISYAVFCLRSEDGIRDGVQ